METSQARRPRLMEVQEGGDRAVAADLCFRIGGEMVAALPPLVPLPLPVEVDA